MKPPLLRCGGENTHNNQYQSGRESADEGLSTATEEIYLRNFDVERSYCVTLRISDDGRTTLE
ncbi:hypothetical protein BRD08_03880 [Halobacteriales archaeon SW_10_66_29]|nr:MAG: hypothetical protein BRD08_03880 [Halobacteriales archaeon SW_10_66_29]